jgi:hypothetical protein
LGCVPFEFKINKAVFESDYTMTSGSLTPRIDIFDTSIPSTELKNVIVLANFDLVSQTVNTSFPSTEDWYDLMHEFGNKMYSAGTVTISAGQFRIFGKAPSTLSTDSFDTEGNFSIYPNPVNTSFKTNKAISSLQIFDITGKLVKTFKGEFAIENSYDISNLT